MTVYSFFSPAVVKFIVVPINIPCTINRRCLRGLLAISISIENPDDLIHRRNISLTGDRREWCGKSHIRISLIVSISRLNATLPAYQGRKLVNWRQDTQETSVSRPFICSTSCSSSWICPLPLSLKPSGFHQASSHQATCPFVTEACSDCRCEIPGLGKLNRPEFVGGPISWGAIKVKKTFSLDFREQAISMAFKNQHKYES